MQAALGSTLTSLQGMAPDDGLSRHAPGDRSQHYFSWEHDLRARKEEVCRQDKQLQLLAADMVSRDEALVALEQHADEELGSIPEQE